MRNRLVVSALLVFCVATLAHAELLGKYCAIDNFGNYYNFSMHGERWTYGEEFYDVVGFGHFHPSKREGLCSTQPLLVMGTYDAAAGKANLGFQANGASKGCQFGVSHVLADYNIPQITGDAQIGGQFFKISMQLIDCGTHQ